MTIENIAPLRLAISIALLCMLMLLEWYKPKKNYKLPDNRQLHSRWPANLSMGLINSFFIRMLFPLAAVGSAAMAEVHGIGILNWTHIKTALPTTVVFITSVVLLDLIIYWQHRLFHKVPVLWRMHKVHHSDQALDASSALRFHFAEIILSMLIKIGVVLLLGVPAIAVLVFEIILNAMAMFNHANLNIPNIIDKKLRLLVVTPDMHRVHHSIIVSEQNSNFGFNISAWDYLFKTYKAQPQQGHDGMEIGITETNNAPPLSLLEQLRLPFKR